MNAGGKLTWILIASLSLSALGQDNAVERWLELFFKGEYLMAVACLHEERADDTMKVIEGTRTFSVEQKSQLASLLSQRARLSYFKTQ